MNNQSASSAGAGSLRSMTVLAACLLMCLAACRPATHRNATLAPQQLAPLPGSRLYSVDDTASRLRLRVYRDGPMAALGHNHVLFVHGLAGSIQLHDELRRSRFVLQFPVAQIEVDDPAARAAAGADFSTQITAGARAGTQRNMLGEQQLNGARQPLVSLRSESITPDEGAAADASLTVSLRVNLRGRETLLQVPLRWQLRGDVLTASGEFSLLQSALGLAPYSVAMGALRVRDQVDVDFDIVARRVRL